jgi:cell division septation protein DedD
MQRFLTGLLALALVGSPALAGEKNTGTDAEKSAAAAPAAKPENSATSEPAAKPESPSMELQLGHLRSLLEAQAEELRAQHAALVEQQKNWLTWMSSSARPGL